MPTQDPITLQRIQTLHPKLRQEALAIYNEILAAGVTVRFVQTFRSAAEQDALYAQGRTKPGKIVTRAKSGFSAHEFGCAIDFCLLLPDKTISWDRNKDMDGDKISDWMEVVKIFKRHGWAWGGDFKSIFDAPHFEKTFGLGLKGIQALKNAGKVDKSGYVLI